MSTAVVETGDRVQMPGDDRIYYVQHVHPAGYWCRLRDASGRHEHEQIDPATLEHVSDARYATATDGVLPRCRYCGPGPCRSTARTANGRDLECFERSHGGRP